MEEKRGVMRDNAQRKVGCLHPSRKGTDRGFFSFEEGEKSIKAALTLGGRGERGKDSSLSQSGELRV